MNKSRKRLRNDLQFTITNDHFRILKNTYSGTQKKKELKKNHPQKTPKTKQTPKQIKQTHSKKRKLTCASNDIF